MAGDASADLFWGPGGNGGSGAWDNTSPNWWNGSSQVAWDGGTAIFGGTAGTVTSFTFGPTVGAIVFNTPGYLIDSG